MKKALPFLAALLAPLATLSATKSSSVAHPANALEAGEPATRQKAVLTQKDVLSIRDRRFYLESKPFAEISFNKFDLFWQLYDQLATGKPLDAANPLVQAQDKALRNLHDMGFRSIRIFALPWGPGGPASYADPAKRKTLYAALDKTLELCDAHDIRVVWSLAASTFTDRQLVPGKGCRTLLYQYIDETVARYKNRKAVLMWEISNEVTLSADIGDDKGVYEGQRMPTLKDVAGFFDDVARRIKAADPLRLINSGGSNMRECQWHRYQKMGWRKDTFEEQFKCFDLLYAKSAVDVIDIHSYPNNMPGYVIAATDGKDTILDNTGYMAIAARLSKPLMIGELGIQPIPKTDKKVWNATPDYFESYANTAAAEKAMRALGMKKQADELIYRTPQNMEFVVNTNGLASIRSGGRELARVTVGISRGRSDVEARCTMTVKIGKQTNAQPRDKEYG